MVALACVSALTALSGGAVLADPGSPGLPAPDPADPSLDTPDISTGPDPSTDDQLERIRRVLALSPAQGTPGAQFTARALGFVSCSTLAFTWDNGQVLGTAGVDRSGVSIGLNVPPDAYAATHTVTVSCDERSATAAYTVIAAEEAKVAVSPETGRPGTQVAVTATGFDACSSGSQTISLQWNGQLLPTSPAGTEVFEVPADATSGAHTVTATCGSTHASADFTVVPTEKPSLTLDKEQGPHGSRLTASGSGFACGGDRVQLLWDGESTLRSDLSDAFSVQLTVPADASTGAHTLVASCSDNPDIAASQAFTVVADTAVSAGATFLSLAPRSGKPGDQVRVNGEGFTCDDNSETVELAWDDGQRFDSPSTDASGNFSNSITIPISADAGGHSVLASCSDGSAAQSAEFTVVDGVIPTKPPTAPPPPPSPEDGNAGWVIALIVAAMILAAVGAYRIWRSKPRPNKSGIHVDAVSSPGGPPLITIRETPAPGEVTHAVRLKTHSDPGTLIVREVSDD